METKPQDEQDENNQSKSKQANEEQKAPQKQETPKDDEKEKANKGKKDFSKIDFIRSPREYTIQSCKGIQFKRNSNEIYGDKCQLLITVAGNKMPFAISLDDLQACTEPHRLDILEKYIEARKVEHRVKQRQQTNKRDQTHKFQGSLQQSQDPKDLTPLPLQITNFKTPQSNKPASVLPYNSEVKENDAFKPKSTIMTKPKSEKKASKKRQLDEVANSFDSPESESKPQTLKRRKPSDKKSKIVPVTMIVHKVHLLQSQFEQKTPGDEPKSDEEGESIETTNTKRKCIIDSDTRHLAELHQEDDLKKQEINTENVNENPKLSTEDLSHKSETVIENNLPFNVQSPQPSQLDNTYLEPSQDNTYDEPPANSQAVPNNTFVESQPENNMSSLMKELKPCEQEMLSQLINTEMDHILDQKSYENQRVGKPSLAQGQSLRIVKNTQTSQVNPHEVRDDHQPAISSLQMQELEQSPQQEISQSHQNIRYSNRLMDKSRRENGKTLSKELLDPSENDKFVNAVFFKQTSKKAAQTFYKWYSENQAKYESPLYGIMDYLPTVLNLQPSSFCGFEEWYKVNRKVFSSNKEDAFRYYLIEYAMKETHIFEHEHKSREFFANQIAAPPYPHTFKRKRRPSYHSVYRPQANVDDPKELIAEEENDSPYDLDADHQDEEIYLKYKELCKGQLKPSLSEESEESYVQDDNEEEGYLLYDYECDDNDSWISEISEDEAVMNKEMQNVIRIHAQTRNYQQYQPDSDQDLYKSGAYERVFKANRDGSVNKDDKSMAEDDDEEDDDDYFDEDDLDVEDKASENANAEENVSGVNKDVKENDPIQNNTVEEVKYEEPGLVIALDKKAFTSKSMKTPKMKAGAATDGTSTYVPPLTTADGSKALIPYKAHQRRTRAKPTFNSALIDELKIFHEKLPQDHHICVFHALNMYLGCIYFQTYWQCIRVVSAITKRGFKHHSDRRVADGLPINGLRFGICKPDTPLEVVQIGKDRYTISSEKDYPHAILDSLNVENAILACKFDYHAKLRPSDQVAQHFLYYHAINLKKDRTRENNWALCDSAFPNVYYIDSPYKQDYILFQDVYYPKIAYYQIYILQPREYKGLHAEANRRKDYEKSRRLMTGEKDHIQKALEQANSSKKKKVARRKQWTNSKASNTQPRISKSLLRNNVDSNVADSDSKNSSNHPILNNEPSTMMKKQTEDVEMASEFEHHERKPLIQELYEDFNLLQAKDQQNEGIVYFKKAIKELVCGGDDEQPECHGLAEQMMTS